MRRCLSFEIISEYNTHFGPVKNDVILCRSMNEPSWKVAVVPLFFLYTCFPGDVRRVVCPCLMQVVDKELTGGVVCDGGGGSGADS